MSAKGQNQNQNKSAEKYITINYLSDGQVEVESAGITVFDLWSLSNYLKMRADEMYLTTLQAQRMKEAAAKQGAIQPVHALPAGMKPQ